MASTTYGVDDPNRSQRWNPKADQWEEGFSRLGHYIERHGAPASRRPSRSMATRSVVGSTCNATGIPKAPLDADRERRLRDLTGLDLGPQGRPLAPDRAPVRPHHGQPRAVRRAARLEGQPRPRPGSARQARRAGPYGAHPELRRRRPHPAGAVPRLRPPRPRPDREAAHGLKPSS